MVSVETHEAPWGSLRVTRGGESFVFTRFGRLDGDEGVEMARYDEESRYLRLFPREGVDHGRQHAYKRIREIQIDTDVWPWDAEEAVVETSEGELQLAGVPEGLGVTFGWGLRLPMHYRRLVREVEAATDCSVIRLGADSGISGDILQLSIESFRGFIRNVELHLGRGRTVVSRLNDTEAHNAVAEALGRTVRTPSPGRLPTIKAMTGVISGETDFDEAGRAELLELVAGETRAAVTEHPETIGRLRADIDLVTLEVLIEQFDAALRGPSASKERTWQTFFRRNAFALQQLFSAPITFVGEQLRVRLPNIHGTGAREPDFLLVNTVTRNVHLVEIKTPTTKMMASNYRGRGEAEVFPPHRDLAGSVAQLQAQVHSARSDLPEILRRTADAPELDPGVVRGAVIVGSIEALSDMQRDSFIRYREGLAGVEVIAFDEVLQRLKGLHLMLSATG